MTNAICFKCASDKPVAFSACGQCGAAPRTQAEYVLSLALSEHLSTKTQLAHFKNEIKKSRRPTIPEALVSQAREALKDPQLMALLGAKPQPTQTTASATQKTRRTSAQTQAEPPISANRRPRKLKETALHRNAFWLLGATTRDDRRRIVELAEEKSLNLDHDTCQKARSDLTSPRTRLAVELAWLPGVSPKKAIQLVRQILQEPLSARSESGLPALAHANLMAAAFEAVDAGDSSEDIATFIQEMAHVAAELSIDDVLRDINEDRTVSGFPEVKSREQVESELAERKRYFRSVIKDALNRLPPAALVDAITKAVDSVTAGGDRHAPELIDELVDSYEVEVQEFLQKEAENIHRLIKATRDCAKSGESAVKPLVDKLESVARNWDKVAQPIQLSAKARGIDHKPSHELAYGIRSVAIDLFNNYDMLTQSQRLTGLLQELFAEIPDVSERVEQDADVLEGIASERNNLAEKFKEFNLTGHAFSYNGEAYDVNEISHIGFYRAITTHKTNFVETGKTERAVLTLTFSGGHNLNISIDEEGIFFNKNKSHQIQTLAEFYSYLSHVTFDRRVGFYESQIEKNGYFKYDECLFYPREKRVEFRDRNFDVSSTSFLRSYGYVELRKKDSGFLDKIKREVSLTKTPQFSTATDTDVIFHLLDKHFGLRWKS